MIHSGHDFTIILHLCALAVALLAGSYIRKSVPLFRKYLIPAPMIGGFLLMFFYNFVAERIGLYGGPDFMEELMYHLLNISFIAMQLRIPKSTKEKRKSALWQNTCALLAEYGLQATFGLVAAMTILKKFLPGSAVSIGLTLPLGFELGPGQAESVSRVWEGAPYFVNNASDVGLAMAAIGFLVGSVVGVVFINQAAKKGWMSQEYVEKLRNRKTTDFFTSKEERIPTSYITTVPESMDTFTLHIGLVLSAYLLSISFLALLEYLVSSSIGGKVLEAIVGLWGINFVISSLFGILVRKIIIACHGEHIIDNGTCNRIDGIAVDFTVVSCLGAIGFSALKGYIVPIIVLSLVGVAITCFITPYFCSRLYDDYSFLRFLMIFGTANGTLPTALSLLRVVDPDFETPAAQDYANSTGVMFVFALPILALINWPAKGMVIPYVILLSLYIVAAFIMYLKIAGKRAFAKGGLFYKNTNN